MKGLITYVLLLFLEKYPAFVEKQKCYFVNSLAISTFRVIRRQTLQNLLWARAFFVFSEDNQSVLRVLIQASGNSRRKEFTKSAFVYDKLGLHIHSC